MSGPALKGGHGFSSRELVATFLRDGSYPAIHDDVAKALSLVPCQGGLLDLGACTGLLSRRAHAMGFSPVVGVEGDRSNVAVFDAYLRTPGVILKNRYLDPAKLEDLNWLSQVIRGNHITTVLARRVLPEVLGNTGDNTDFAACRDKGCALGRTLSEAGVQHLVIEGRVPHSRAVHCLSTVEAEMTAMAHYWQPTHRLKACAVLARRDP